MSQLLRVQSKVEACAGKLEQLSGDKARKTFGCRIYNLTLRAERDVVSSWYEQLSNCT